MVCVNLRMLNVQRGLNVKPNMCLPNWSDPRFRAALALMLAAGCAPSLPGPSGARPVAVRPDTLWSPPPKDERQMPAERPVQRELPPEIAARRTALTLEDVVALALEGSPDARESWANARAEAASYGQARGAW